MTLWVGIVNILFRPSAAPGGPTNTCLKPRYVVLYVSVHELFTVRDYDTQSTLGLQYPKKLTQNGQAAL